LGVATEGTLLGTVVRGTEMVAVATPEVASSVAMATALAIATGANFRTGTPEMM
jgi:hypothetical protein